MTTNAPERWTFDAPYTASFNGTGADTWLGLKAHGILVASYSVKEWGSEQACIEAAWSDAYDPPADLIPSPEVVKELVEALRDIAGQKTFLEMTIDEHASADFEDGYDLCVRRARAALAKLGGGE